MSILSLDQLKRKVRWNDIVLRQGVHSYRGEDHPFCMFKVLPSKKNWPSIDLHFDGEIQYLDPLCFSQWHAHYDRWEDERRNLIDALRTVRDLVARKICLVEELDEAGACRGGSLLPPEGIPETLSKEVTSFRRIFFDRPPLLQEVDFSRYWAGKHLYVEWRCKEETETLWKEQGMSIDW